MMISDTITNILLNVVVTNTLNVINLTNKCNSSYIVTVSIHSSCSALSITSSINH